MKKTKIRRREHRAAATDRHHQRIFASRVDTGIKDTLEQLETRLSAQFQLSTIANFILYSTLFQFRTENFSVRRGLSIRKTLMKLTPMVQHEQRLGSMSIFLTQSSGKPCSFRLISSRARGNNCPFFYTKKRRRPRWVSLRKSEELNLQKRSLIFQHNPNFLGTTSARFSLRAPYLSGATNYTTLSSLSQIT